MSTDYEAYAILDVQLHRGAASIRVLKLYSEPAGPDGVGCCFVRQRAPGAGWGGERGREGLQPRSRPPSFTGRALEQDKDILKQFHQVAKDYGLSPRDVHLNTWDSECRGPARPLGPAPP